LLSSLLDQSVREGCFQHIQQKLSETSQKLLKEFLSLKCGILKELSLVSSLKERVQDMNLNCTYGRDFMKEIIEFTVSHMNSTRKNFDEKIKEVQLLPEELQQKIYSKFSGPVNFDMEVEKHFSLIGTWVSNWIEVQVISIVQREIFAKTRKELEILLEENKKRIVQGFKELITSKILEPLISLDELLVGISNEIELVKSL